MKKQIFIITILCVLSSCASPKKASEKTPEKQTDTEQIITAPIIEKQVYNKAGKKMDFTDYFLRQSVQDYFIKFCESKVTRKELEGALAEINSPIKTLTLKVEFREGEWDSCDDFPVQSRIGRYVILLGVE